MDNDQIIDKDADKDKVVEALSSINIQLEELTKPEEHFTEIKDILSVISESLVRISENTKKPAFRPSGDRGGRGRPSFGGGDRGGRSGGGDRGGRPSFGGGDRGGRSGGGDRGGRPSFGGGDRGGRSGGGDRGGRPSFGGGDRGGRSGGGNRGGRSFSRDR